MTTKRITWNTGALYSAEGQVITAEFDFETGRVIFKDHSRSIDGVFRERLPLRCARLDDEGHLRAWLVTEYLHNRYDFDASGDAGRLQRVARPPAKKEGTTMINHPNRSKRRVPRIRVTLANDGGPLDERLVSAHPDWSEDQIAEVVARSAIELIRETRFLHAGDVITVTEIERS